MSDRCILLHNARFLTVDPHHAAPDAILIEGARITFVGSLDEARARASVVSPSIAAHDLKQRTVIPGLIDMHAHLDREGLKDLLPSMRHLRTRRDVLARIAQLAAATEPGRWIVTMPIGEPPFYLGHGDDLDLYPTRWELDEVAPDNPVFIKPIIGFWRWAPLPERLVSSANSRALASVALDDASRPPTASVTFEKHRGRLTGRFIERTALSVIEITHFSGARPFSHDDRRTALRPSQAAALAVGITTIFEGHGADPAVVAAYEALHAQGGLDLRVELAFSPDWTRTPVTAGDAPLWPAEIEQAGHGDDRFRIRGLFVNPTVTAEDKARAAACCYTGMVGYRSGSGLQADALAHVLQVAAARKLRVVGLDSALFAAFEAAGGALGGWLVQHRSHLPEAHDALCDRLGLGLTFLPVEAIYKQAAMARRRPDDARDWMPLRRLIDRKRLMSLSTDNIPPSLFFAIWCCLARQDRGGEILPDPDGPITRLEALELATLGGARCLGRADDLGSLTTGKYADLAVLDRDYLTCDLDAIADITAVATMVGGRWVHGSPDDC